MTTRRTFLENSGLALGEMALPSSAVLAQSTEKQKTVLLQCGWATKNIGDIGDRPGALQFLEQ